MEKNIGEIEEVVKSWFENHKISLLNIYVLALILIEQMYEGKEEKSKMVTEFINLILDLIVIDKNRKEEILNEMNEESETLEEVGKIMIEICNNPDLLQKDKYISKKIESRKVFYCRPETKTNFSFGIIKK